MSQGAVAIRGYIVLSESRRAGGFTSYRVRDEDSAELLTLHVFPRHDIDRDEVRALLADLPRYSELNVRQIARPRRLRADENFVIVEVESAEGASVETLLERRADPQDALKIVEDLLVGLVAAEMRGLHHGALRPSCVIVGDDGRASIDGFGFGSLYPDTGDFYSKLAADVPVSMSRRHAKDVCAAVALLHHLAEGRPPFEPDGRDFESRLRNERWPGSRFREIYDAVFPFDRAEAGEVLRRIRAASSATRPVKEPGPSLLDTPDEPAAAAEIAPPPSRWRRWAAEPALPVIAAGVAGALIALTFGAPFLGADSGRPPSVASAIPLPSAVPLAPVPEPRPEPVAPKDADRPTPRRRTAEDEWRQMVVALSEIGDYPGALALLAATKDVPAGKIGEERDAVLAAARRKFDELREIGRALTAEQRLDDALKEWDAMKGGWPEADLSAAADKEREFLSREADSLRAVRDARERLRAAQRQAARFRGMCRRLLFEERYDFTEQLGAIDALLDENPVDGVALAESYAALRQFVLRKSAYFKKSRKSLESRRPVPMARVSSRLGGGEIVGLGDDTVLIRRPDASIARLPLTRLDGREKLALFREVRMHSDGADALAIALFGFSWGLREHVEADLDLAEASGDVPARLMEAIRKIVKEE